MFKKVSGESVARFKALSDIRYSTAVSEERVRKGAEKLAKFLNTKQQGRLDGFFTVQAKTSPKKDTSKKGDAKGTKRKVDRISNL